MFLCRICQEKKHNNHQTFFKQKIPKDSFACFGKGLQALHAVIFPLYSSDTEKKKKPLQEVQNSKSAKANWAG